VDTSSFRSATSLLQTTDPKKSKSTNTHKSNDGFSISTTSATPVGGTRATATKPAGYTTDTQETPPSPPATLCTTATTVLIGNELFDLPSPACWTLALQLHQMLQPIAIHITMMQCLQLARKLTRSKVITATKGLKIKRDIFTDSTSVHDLIDSIDAEPHQVISILNGWHRQTFETMDKLLQKRFQQLKYNPAATSRTNLPEANSPGKNGVSPVIDLQDTHPRPRTIRLSPLPKEQRRRSAESTVVNSEATSPGKRQKNDKDGNSPAASLHKSKPKQSTTPAGANSSSQKKMPPTNQKQAQDPSGANSSSQKKMPPPGANSSKQKQTPLSIQKMPPTAPKNARQRSTTRLHGRVLAYKPPDVNPDATETSNTKRRNRSRGKKRKSICETTQDPNKSNAPAND
jgi:hypothetical protein